MFDGHGAPIEDAARRLASRDRLEQRAPIARGFFEVDIYAAGGGVEARGGAKPESRGRLNEVFGRAARVANR